MMASHAERDAEGDILMQPEGELGLGKMAH